MNDDFRLEIPVFDLDKIGNIILEELGDEWEDALYEIFGDTANLHYRQLHTTHPLFLILNRILDAEKADKMIMVAL